MLAAAAWVSAHWVSLSPDARYSLAWGAQLARGEAPEVDAGAVSTPHPLPIALSALLSLLGPRTAADLYAFAAAVAFALLVYAGFRLGRALGGAVAGVAAALLVATRDHVVFFASRAFIDIPFAALVLLAAALVAEAPRRHATPALALLALAGLLRPEAWGLAALYAAWLLLAGAGGRDESPPRQRVVALAGAAPAIWVGMDLALTGNPLHSLQGTQENAELLRRATGIGELLPSLRGGLADLIGLAPALAGAAFGAWALARRYQPRAPFAVAAALAGAGIAAFALLAVADLPLNDRYLVVPALTLLALAGAALARARRELVAAAAAALALVPVALALPDDLAAAREAVEGAASKARADEDLERLIGRDDVRAAIEGCGRVLASSSARAAVAALLDRDPAQVRIARAPIPPAGWVALSTADTVPPATPRSLREGAWAFVERC